jgi:hypothetical protein
VVDSDEHLILRQRRIADYGGIIAEILVPDPPLGELDICTYRVFATLSTERGHGSPGGKSGEGGF